MSAIIEVSDVRKDFRVREKNPGLSGSLRALLRPAYRDIVAVRDLRFALDPGEVVAFIGPNGAGKSTTIKMLTGILHPTAGQARVLGLVPWRQRQTLAYHIAVIFGQRSQLWYHLPPHDSFDLLAHIYELDRVDYQQRLRQLVEEFEIGPLLRTPVRKLSLGQRMRCEIAGALLHRPRVLFLDEPTIGLDVVAKQRIRAHIRDFVASEGATVLLTSHDASDVEQLCRRAIIINHGQIIFDDSVSVLKQRFIRTKRIELTLSNQATLPVLPGVTALAHGDYTLTLEVDVTVQSIDRVIAAIMAAGGVSDVTIADPPLEEIIAHIYGGASCAA